MAAPRLLSGKCVVIEHEPVPALEQNVVRANGLTLRQWNDGDLPQMVALFNTAEISRWTPLAYPFDEEAAATYIWRARAGIATGTLQFAITEKGDQSIGEVLLFPSEQPTLCEFAYAVGIEHRGRSVAARALTALLPIAKTYGYLEARLRIATDNTSSQKVALATGFILTDQPLVRRESKGYEIELQTWIRDLP